MPTPVDEAMPEADQPAAAEDLATKDEASASAKETSKDAVATNSTKPDNSSATASAVPSTTSVSASGGKSIGKVGGKRRTASPTINNNDHGATPSSSVCQLQCFSSHGRCQSRCGCANGSFFAVEWSTIVIDPVLDPWRISFRSGPYRITSLFFVRVSVFLYDILASADTRTSATGRAQGRPGRSSFCPLEQDGFRATVEDIGI